MHERYDYYDITFERGGAQRLRASFHGAASDALGGAYPYALFFGLIGVHTDEAVAMTFGPDARVTESDEEGVPAIALGGMRDAHVTTLVPTVRPVDSTPPAEDGVYAHRWFWIDPEHELEFIDLSSDGVWPFFESDGCRIVGLWKAVDAEPLCALLLITRYPSVAHWERTRLQSPGAPPGADAGLYARAREAARRRAELTQRSIVRLTRLAPPP